ncbi:hypothetical protein ACFQZZ_02530 [Nocardia sp. GCM10030253]|uniref:hypothetical protein n=1 Tax=Nocardia sp. GCM10030253 TaxID=3273404 RepID=UPI00363F46CF
MDYGSLAIGGVQSLIVARRRKAASTREIALAAYVSGTTAKDVQQGPRADLSPRVTEFGREPLRLLEISAPEPAGPRSLAGSLPIHRAPAVAEPAGQNAENGRPLADSSSRRLVTDT